MAELAKLYMSVVDESFYGAGTGAIIPLYIIATESNKVLDSTTGEIAPGTTMANELLVMTSQKDVVNTFGIPSFEKVNGTIMQGSELNEVGLLGLYDAMGSSALGYAVRADIDLKQLKPTSVEPKSFVKNGTRWFDVESSTFAVYRKTTNEDSLIPLKNWERVEVEVCDSRDDVKEPLDSQIIFEASSKSFLEYIVTGVSNWYVIGSDAWASKKGNGVRFTFGSHTEIPEGFTQGSIWIQTTTPNDGTKLVKKTFNEAIKSWVASLMYVYKTTEEAEDSLVLTEGSDVVICDERDAKLYIKKYGSWEEDTEIKVQTEEPTAAPKDGTLWFDDSIKVDILVNKGTEWVGLTEMYPDAKFYVTSEEPTEDVSDMSIWVDTNDTTYPSIYRYFDGMWNLCDNSDQSTAMGVVFADARYYDMNDEVLTFEEKDGVVSGTVLTSGGLDPDAPEAKSYPKGILLFNTRFSSNNVKKYYSNAFEGFKAEDLPGKTLARWMTESGNALDGSGLFGREAQRKMVVEALAGAVNSCEELSSINYDFFFACCPGYPEVDEALYNLNADKKEMFYVVSDTPKGLKPTVRAITDWGSNASNAEHGEKGRVIRSAYATRQYPPMGITSNVDGTSVAIPTSIVKMNNLLNLPTGQICAGTQFGVVSNVSSVGYITDEGEYSSVSVNDGLGEGITAQSMNPIMARRNTGLLFWGENTEYGATSSLSDEHAILTLLRLKRELETAVQPFFFRKNTQAVRNDFDRVLRNILTSYVGSEELYDFALDTETPNTAETIERKELHANIAIEIVKGIEFIYLPIRVVNTGSLSDSTIS